MQIAFFSVLIITLFCLTQQLRMHHKKKTERDYAVWSKYHKWQYFYSLVGLPFALTTGVLLPKVLPMWIM